MKDLNLSRILTILTSPGIFSIYPSLIFSFFSPKPSSLDPISSSIIGILLLSSLPTVLAIYIAKKRNYDVFLAPHKERSLLYIFTGGISLIAALFFWYFNAPAMLLISLMYITLAISLGLINLFWKISAHAAGTAGPITALIYVYGINLIPLYLIVLSVIFLRYKGKAHTIPQLIGGLVIGIVVAFLTYATFY